MLCLSGNGSPNYVCLDLVKGDISGLRSVRGYPGSQISPETPRAEILSHSTAGCKRNSFISNWSWQARHGCKHTHAHRHTDMRTDGFPRLQQAPDISKRDWVGRQDSRQSLFKKIRQNKNKKCKDQVWGNKFLF